jgi:hypothetical protein
MFYKHWKKITLALTGFFWASCDNNGITPNDEPPVSSSDNQSSSSEVTPASSSSSFDSILPLYGIMSSVVQSSNSNVESSSSFEQVMPAYGVVSQVACYEDKKGVKTNGEIAIIKLQCDDGVVCKEREVIKEGGSEPCSISDEGDLKGAVACPDYGVVYVTEKTYDCDGVTYNEAEFKARYFNAGQKTTSSSSTEQSSSSAEVTCSPNLSKLFTQSRVDRYSMDNVVSNASTQAKFDASGKIAGIRDSLSTNTPQCLNDMYDDIERSFVAAYGSPYANRIPAEETCSDGTTRPTKEYLEQQAFDKEQEKKRPQYEEKYNEIYKEESEKLDKKINDCLNSEKNVE